MRIHQNHHWPRVNLVTGVSHIKLQRQLEQSNVGRERSSRPRRILGEQRLLPKKVTRDRQQYPQVSAAIAPQVHDQSRRIPEFLQRIAKFFCNRMLETIETNV